MNYEPGASQFVSEVTFDWRVAYSRADCPLQRWLDARAHGILSPVLKGITLKRHECRVPMRSCGHSASEDKS